MLCWLNKTNCPGEQKQSAVGRENALEGLEVVRLVELPLLESFL